MKIRFNRWEMSVCWLFMAACANIVPPDGGEKDIQPPKLVSQSLKDSLLSVKPNQLSLQFDEYITVADAQKEISMSPSIDAPLTVSYTYKKITVAWPDSVLLPNTTYRLHFGNAIKDLNEGNIYQRNAFVFSLILIVYNCRAVFGMLQPVFRIPQPLFCYLILIEIVPSFPLNLFIKQSLVLLRVSSSMGYRHMLML